MSRGTLLHVSLSKVSDCLGIDIDEGALSVLRDHYAFQNVRFGDAEHLDLLDAGTFDVVVAGELIEHLNNPGRFLETCKSVLRHDGRLIISTTNAFCLRRFLRIPFGVESVHPDHICYFSHSTLHNFAERFGYKLIAAYGYAMANRTPFYAYVIERSASLLSPNLCEGIVHVYSLGDDSGGLEDLLQPQNAAVKDLVTTR